MTAGTDLIAEERQRQIEVEGWDADHDSGHGHEIARAALAYLLPPFQRTLHYGGFLELDLRRLFWPWGEEAWKPLVPDGHGIAPDRVQSRIRELVKAGALIAAAIDDLNRESQP